MESNDARDYWREENELKDTYQEKLSSNFGPWPRNCYKKIMRLKSQKGIEKKNELITHIEQEDGRKDTLGKETIKWGKDQKEERKLRAMK